MSQPVPCGRAKSRWSVPEHPETEVGIASTAGLVALSANVSVLPPLNAEAAVRNAGLVFCRSPVDLKPQSVPVSML